MKRFQYVGGPDKDQFFQGLPALDLDPQDLTPDQQIQMYVAVSRGLYLDTLKPLSTQKEDTDGQSTIPAPEQMEGEEESDARQTEGN